MRDGPQPGSTPAARRPVVTLEQTTDGDVVVVRVAGLVDERFAGFGEIGHAKTIVIDVSGMARMTSFGVRQWMKGMEALPKSVTERYLLGCPMFFVDQLNMVLNFGGGAQILTATAPYSCSSCGAESGEVIDLIGERGVIARGAAPERRCSSCNGKLELEESPESYFTFVSKHGATKLRSEVATHLAQLGIYVSQDAGADKPPKVIKLVQGEVTYFRISGSIGQTFRARPFIIGTEGEVVLDLGDVTRFDVGGLHEWRRLVKTLANQVEAVTLVDVSQSFLAMAPDSFAMAKNVYVASVLVPYQCVDCKRASQQSYTLTAPIPSGVQVCSTCGGNTENQLPPRIVASLAHAASNPPAASAKVIARRDEMLSRALTDEKVAQASEASDASNADDTVIGNYKIVRKLSAGGMAEVFLASQIGIGGFEKPVALKRIQRKFLESRHLAIDMFLNEAKIAGRLAHPNIVQVLDVGEVGGALFLAMEYVRGKDLRDVVKMLQANGDLIPLGLACYIVREVAQALHHAYWSTDHEGNRLSVVHRDVSPHNIILSFDGAVKLLDFGVAMSSVTEQDEPMIVGKWSYMSPEHTTKAIDHRSDLFSLGVVLYLLCSGRMPFHGAEPVEIIDNIEEGQYAPLTGVPEPLAELVNSLLRPNPAERPQTGQAVASALAEILRNYRLEQTSADVAAFLGQLFAYEVIEQEPVLGSEGHDTIAMEMTTIRLAVGSSPTQAQDTPSASVPVVPSTVSPSGLLDTVGGADVTFTPVTPVSRSANLVWIAAVIALVVVVAILIGIVISRLD
ncbi:MAG: serine/threonine protein kinase [Myxococcota bacterium]|nr:serine/threonine protein kinase [Deltaproteobacteria bacterium]MDQ3334994.1 serine/threonine protein kinase [Myxococcota bacterium]